MEDNKTSKPTKYYYVDFIRFQEYEGYLRNSTGAEGDELHEALEAQLDQVFNGNAIVKSFTEVPEEEFNEMLSQAEQQEREETVPTTPKALH